MIFIKACICSLFLCVVGFGLGGLLGLAVFEFPGPCGAAWIISFAQGALCGAVCGAVAGFIVGLVV